MIIVLSLVLEMQNTYTTITECKRQHCYQKLQDEMLDIKIASILSIIPFLTPEKFSKQLFYIYLVFCFHEVLLVKKISSTLLKTE